MEWRVPLVDLNFDEREERAVLDVLRSRWLTMGKVTLEFEQAFASLLGCRYAVAVSNATQALHLACLTLGIGPGDEVILPSLTFVATANSVLYSGAQVCFADVLGPTELTISPGEVEKLITRRTKAIVVVHYGGYACVMQPILDLARHYGLAIIEDAAHAPGASLNGKPLGTWGDVGCFSFFSNKNMTTGEGGMLVTNREDVAERARLLRSHGMTALTWERHHGHASSYDVVALGYNYRIDEIRAALGLVQLDRLQENNERRRSITQRYWQELGDSGLILPFRGMERESACHLLPILLPGGIERKTFMNYLRKCGIQTSVHYPPLHQFQYYRNLYLNVSLPITEDVGARLVSLPLYPGLDEEKIGLVVMTIKQALTTISPME